MRMDFLEGKAVGREELLIVEKPFRFTPEKERAGRIIRKWESGLSDPETEKSTASRLWLAIRNS